jgi:hypothetical protein
MTKLPEALIPADDFLRSGLIFIVVYFSLDLRCAANISAFVSSSLSLSPESPTTVLSHRQYLVLSPFHCSAQESWRPDELF